MAPWPHALYFLHLPDQWAFSTSFQSLPNHITLLSASSSHVNAWPFSWSIFFFMAQCIKQDKNISLALIFHLNLHLKHENRCQPLTPRNEMLCSALHIPPRMSHEDLVRCFYKDPNSCNECFQPGRLPQSAESSDIYICYPRYIICSWLSCLRRSYYPHRSQIDFLKETRIFI